MDPMKVDIAVSPETDARVNYNDLVRIFAPNGDQLEGLVYLKDTFADPGTRTFLITLLVRNRHIEIGVPEELKGQEVSLPQSLEIGQTGSWRLGKLLRGGERDSARRRWWSFRLESREPDCQAVVWRLRPRADSEQGSRRTRGRSRTRTSSVHLPRTRRHWWSGPKPGCHRQQGLRRRAVIGRAHV